MKRFVLLLGLAGLVAACDSGVSEAPAEPLALTVTIAGGAGESIGAALFSIPVTPEDIVVPGGWAYVGEDEDGAVVAAVLSVGQTELTVNLDVVATEPPTVTIRQVSDANDMLFPSPDAFTATVDQREPSQ
jgi:hypothetical protein